MKKRILVLILIVGGMFFSQAAFGQSRALGVSPLTFELSGTPGDIIENYLKVYNPSANIITVKMQVEDISPAGEMGFVTVEPAETESYSLAGWIKVDEEEFNLNPWEEKSVKFVLTIPHNAEPGGHYGTVLAGTKSIAGAEIIGTAIVQRIGALVLLTVPGEMKENLIIKDFSAPRYSEYGPINFSIKFENTGSVHVKPTGLITITDWLGKKVAVVSFPEKNVLPGAIRKHEIPLNYKWLWAGKYTATLTGNYGVSNFQLMPTVITFWAFPWKFGLIILFAVLLLILARKRFAVALRVLIRGR